MDLTKDTQSDNYNKYTQEELADQIPVTIDFEDGMYILHSDLFEIENENLEEAIEECIKEHSDFNQIRDDLQFDDYDDVIWSYYAPTKECPYGRLVFTYHQAFDSQWKPEDNIDTYFTVKMISSDGLDTISYDNDFYIEDGILYYLDEELSRDTEDIMDVVAKIIDYCHETVLEITDDDNNIIYKNEEFDDEEFEESFKSLNEKLEKYI